MPADAIRFRCPCGYRLKVPLELGGKAGKCPECGAAIRVPSLEDSQRKIRRKKGEDSERRRERDESPRPKERRRPKGRRRSEDDDSRDEEDSRRRGRRDDDSRDDDSRDDDSRRGPTRGVECHECGEEQPRRAKTCEECGAELGLPTFVGKLFNACGWTIVGFGLLGALNVILMFANAGFRALIPAAIAATISGALVRVGLGVRAPSRLSVGVGAVLGLLSLLVNVPMTLAVLSGANVYLAPGVKLHPPVVLFSLVVTTFAYFTPVVLSVRYGRRIKWR